MLRHVYVDGHQGVQICPVRGFSFFCTPWHVFPFQLEESTGSSIAFLVPTEDPDETSEDDPHGLLYVQVISKTARSSPIRVQVLQRGKKPLFLDGKLVVEREKTWNIGESLVHYQYRVTRSKFWKKCQKYIPSLISNELYTNSYDVSVNKICQFWYRNWVTLCNPDI